MSREWIQQRMALLRKQAGFAFNQDLVISILLCLMSGRDKHLILTASPHRLAEVAHMATLVARCLFGLSTASIVCQPDQSPAALIQSLFAATIEDHMDASTTTAAAATPPEHRSSRFGDSHDPLAAAAAARNRGGAGATQSLYFQPDSSPSLPSFRTLVHRSYSEDEGSGRGVYPVSPIDFTMASRSSSSGRRRSPPQMRYVPSASDVLSRRTEATTTSARSKESDALINDLSSRSSGKLAQAAIIQNIDATDLTVQATLLELIVAKELKIGNARFTVPKPHFLVILVLPRICTPPLSSQLLDRFFVSFDFDEDAFTSLPRGPGRRVPLIKNEEIHALANQASKVHINIDVTRYIRDIVVGVRAHPLVQGGLTARTSQDLVKVTRSLAAIFQRDYLTPDMVSIAASKVLGHRIRLLPQQASSSSDERRKCSSTDVVAEILRVVYVPV